MANEKVNIELMQEYNPKWGNCSIAVQWLYTYLIPALWRQRQEDQGQPGLQIKLQERQHYTMRLCYENNKVNKITAVQKKFTLGREREELGL